MDGKWLVLLKTYTWVVSASGHSTFLESVSGSRAVHYLDIQLRLK